MQTLILEIFVLEINAVKNCICIHTPKSHGNNPTVLLFPFSSIDTTETQNVPGFVCFVSDQDVPGSNISGICNDETIFAKDIVCNYCFSSTNCSLNLKDTKIEQSSHLHYSSMITPPWFIPRCVLYILYSSIWLELVNYVLG